MDCSNIEESKPLCTLEELLNWDSSNIDRAHIAVPCVQHKSRSLNKTKTLLCHDMKGGYLDDKYINGCNNDLAYRFYHWSLIDIFIYFSHDLVTIPPVTWTTAGHRNGVSVLGTIILEGWINSSKDICRKIFENDNEKDSEELITQVAVKLTEISKFYNFDGWLVNVECDTGRTDRLVGFLDKLTKLMHNKNKNDKHNTPSVVLWYDSVTHPSGTLEWQNELNYKNKCFFDVCDGIFLNYTWDEDNLNNSHQLSKIDHRQSDVYVGIDVFGRGCLCAGGFDCHLAVQIINKYQLSIAIFAPAWTYEVLGCVDFVKNEYLFWQKINLDLKHCPSQLPLVTSFCQGFGHRVYNKGEIIDNKSWHNLSLQHIQPCSHTGLQVYSSDAYNSGCSLLMKSSSSTPFCFQIELTTYCIFSITYKFLSSQDSKSLDFQVSYEVKKNVCKVDLNDKDDINYEVEKDISYEVEKDVCKIHFNNRDDENVLRDNEKLKILKSSSFIENKEVQNKLSENDIDLNNSNGWKTDVFLFHFSHDDKITLKSITILNQYHKQNEQVLLGHYALIPICSVDI